MTTEWPIHNRREEKNHFQSMDTIILQDILQVEKFCYSIVTHFSYLYNLNVSIWQKESSFIGGLKFGRGLPIPFEIYR